MAACAEAHDASPSRQVAPSPTASAARCATADSERRWRQDGALDGRLGMVVSGHGTSSWLGKEPAPERIETTLA
ncbi:MAG: hypothetical protein MZW92_60200, partial [Comamonadaceae bacterium]|nr:hypothetical protein [Comamonadaceae bacterium]